MQPFSWIHINDLIRAFEEAINDATYEGIYNLTAPNPTTNLGLTKALGKVLSRPTIFRAKTSPKYGALATCSRPYPRPPAHIERSL